MESTFLLDTGHVFFLTSADGNYLAKETQCLEVVWHIKTFYPTSKEPNSL